MNVLKRFILLTLFLLFSAASAASSEPAHTYDLKWTIKVASIPDGAKEARLWIALPQELPEQEVSHLAVTSSQKWKAVIDPTFHNKVAMVSIAKPGESISIDLSARVVRRPVDSVRPAVLTPQERKLYLRHEALVSLSPRMKALADSVGGSNRDRYNFVMATMDYDKVTPGWGHGDSERACDVHKGNCTDYHSLFMSLSRSEGIPTVFEMGYPTVAAGETNHEGGYHCWAWFYDESQKGWVPVDISEADKHPEKAEYFFGHLDADRITFSRGRDVVLPGMKGAPLNYLPAGAYVEVDGKPVSDGLARVLSYTVDATP